MPESSVDEIVQQWNQVRPDLDCGSMGIVARLRRTSAHWQKQIDALFKQHGLSAIEFDILATMRRMDDTVTPTDIYRSTMLSSGAVSTNLEKLVQSGWVARIASEQDRRSCKVHLTEQGVKLVDGVVTEHVANMDGLVSSLTVKERQQLDAILSKLV